MEKYSTIGPDSTKILWSDIHGLYKAYFSEIADFPNGDGPALQAAWKKVIGREKKERGQNGTSGKALSPTGAQSIAAVVNSPLFKRIALALTLQGRETVAMLDAELCQLENDSVILGTLRGHLGSTLDEVLAEAIEAQADEEVTA
jgi:hypothetical protein